MAPVNQRDSMQERIAKLRESLNSIRNGSQPHSGAEKWTLGEVANRALLADDIRANVQNAITVPDKDVKARMARFVERLRMLAVSSHSPRTLEWVAQEIEKELGQ